ncbi:MAG: glucosidase [Planctomycetota bacterium]|nr:glucosidase [Planctomycetota bacterium]
MKPGNAERRRLDQDRRRKRNWKRWGPYLSERQWGTVREDYSEDGSCWDYLSHDHARSRAYRWGEDGLFGFSDRQCRLCFSLALWNGQDPILKERLYGLTGPQGNHGEDVKEEYFYLDNVPTHSWMRMLYKYPQAEFPYQQLITEAETRTREEREFELADTGVFGEGRYFDVFVDYAKADAEDVLVRITVHNRGPDRAVLHVLPQLWFRNTWSWGREGDHYWPRGEIERRGDRCLRAVGADLEPFLLELDEVQGGTDNGPLFTENETNHARLTGEENEQPYVKDAFHQRLVHLDEGAVNPDQRGSKAAFWTLFEVDAGDSVELRLRLRPESAATGEAFGRGFGDMMTRRARQADVFYRDLMPAGLSAEAQRVQRQAFAGLLWSKQFYYFDVRTWIMGDSTVPSSEARQRGRNRDWWHLFNRDVISMPDKWEYPWYAAWDLAFHMLPMARLDTQFAKEQLLLFLREWYMAPSGQLPAYEFAFSDVNPPVHAWACLRVYEQSAKAGRRDHAFLARVFHKLLLNFTWWVNQKDVSGKHVFGGGFLGLDNIGVFDRGQPLPGGGRLEQADGTAWMAFYCGSMLRMALELAEHDPTYEDVASKFFEHFMAITRAMNKLGGTGLWDEEDGFYYDQIYSESGNQKLRIRSIVGLIPLYAVQVFEASHLRKLQGFHKRMTWFLEHEDPLAGHVLRGDRQRDGHEKVLLTMPSKERLVRVLSRLLDEGEFLSDFGIRSLSARHREEPFVFEVDGEERRVDYAPGESTTEMFGGNSNWRGPVWFPVNYLLIESLRRYGEFYGDSLQVECPTGSGQQMTLGAVADELSMRLSRLFLPGADGVPPFAGEDRRFADDPQWRDLVWFHEYFDGDTGRGCGASHQTGWTSLVTLCQKPPEA